MADLRRVMPNAAWYAVCTLIALLFLFPVAMMIFQSVKTPTEAAGNPLTVIPESFSLENYRKLSGEGTNIEIWRHVLNSVLVTAGAVLGTVALSALGGYGFSRLPFRGSGILFFVVLATLMIPFQAIITPLFEVLRTLHLSNSLVGLTLIYITFQLPFGLFLMRNSFQVVPRAIEEAALLDGCTVVGAMWRVMLPVALPGIITTALFTFFTIWNEFFAALILISDQGKYPLPVTLSILQTGQFGTLDWGVLQAGVVLTALPCMIIFLLLQRYYVRGLVMGAVK